MLKYLPIFAAFLCIVQCSVPNASNGTKVSPPKVTPLGRTGLLARTVIPDGYVPTPAIHAAHKLHLWKLTWNKARRVCYDEGGQLAVINSFTEMYILLDMMNQKKVELAWLGVHDLYEKNDWTTITGVPLTATGFVGWKEGEPNNSGGNEHCVELWATGSRGMNDKDCSNERPFICKVSI